MAKCTWVGLQLRNVGKGAGSSCTVLSGKKAGAWDIVINSVNLAGSEKAEYDAMLKEA